MKKRNRSKLRIAKKTLRNLVGAELARAAGGGQTTQCPIDSVSPTRLQNPTFGGSNNSCDICYTE